jgi:Asp-tRNA(Asn)/Glu-tRNA(Gln) amidotransferase A subunit family amidase
MTGEPASEVLAACDRIEECDPAIGAFLPEPGRRARASEDALVIRDRWAGSPLMPLLYWLPLGVKDVFRVDGLPTRAGSALPPEVLDGAQAAAVTRLRDAGAVVAGKTVTAEFAFFAPGPTSNPRAPGRTPGGSSSGSAAAVAAGLVPLALGTQTIASIIRPAAYCGIAGFRPSHGRVPTAGVIAFAPSLDTVGWFAPEVAGLARAAAALCDDWQAVGQAGLPVLGIPSGPYLEHASKDALAAFAETAALLRAGGFTVREVPALPDFAVAQRQLFVITRYELAREHAARFARYGELYRPQTAAAIREGLAIPAAEHLAALRWQAALQRDLPGLMHDAGIDAWITPAATGPAPAGLASTGDPVMSVPWSLAGLPALSLPAGEVGGLPVGLQCVGRPGEDERLLALAAALEPVLRSSR